MSEWKEIKVFSEKYNVEGRIRNWGNVVNKLEFYWDGREIEIGLETSFGVFKDAKEEALAIMEDYIEKLYRENRKTMLHYWHLLKLSIDGEEFIQAQGNVTGHARIGDSGPLFSSAVQEVTIDWEAEEALVQTRNTLYHCPLDYLNFEKQESSPELVPCYTEIKEKYQGNRKEPTIEPGKVLVVFSDFDEYYFHSLYYISEKDAEPARYSTYPHVGMFQDSYLIDSYEHAIDIRYFPHYQNVEFYSEYTDEKPLYLENIGNSILYFATSVGIIKLEPGERKEVLKENAEKNKPKLAKGDLYPAGVIE